jgi:hypothetical protein
VSRTSQSTPPTRERPRDRPPAPRAARPSLRLQHLERTLSIRHSTARTRAGTCLFNRRRRSSGGRPREASWRASPGRVWHAADHVLPRPRHAWLPPRRLVGGLGARTIRPRLAAVAGQAQRHPHRLAGYLANCSSVMQWWTPPVRPIQVRPSTTAHKAGRTQQPPQTSADERFESSGRQDARAKAALCCCCCAKAAAAAPKAGAPGAGGCRLLRAASAAAEAEAEAAVLLLLLLLRCCWCSAAATAEAAAAAAAASVGGGVGWAAERS